MCPCGRINSEELQQTDPFYIEELWLCGRILNDRLKSSDAANAVALPQRTCRTAGLWPDSLDRKHSSPLLGQLGSRLRVRVEQREVGYDDRNRKCDGQYAGERTQRPDEHPQIRLRRHITVANGRHGYNRPPQSYWDGINVLGQSWTSQDADVTGHAVRLGWR